MPGPAENDRAGFLVRLILESLDAFDRREIDLGALVSDVESTIVSLQDVADDEWVSELRSAWSGLEIVHAVMLDDGRAELSDKDRREVGEVVRELRATLGLRGAANDSA